MVYIIGIIVTIVLVMIFSRPEMRACRWRADRTRDADGQSFYRCAACGAEALTPDGKPPKGCLKNG